MRSIEFFINIILERNLLLQSGAVLRAAIADDSVPVLVWFARHLLVARHDEGNSTVTYFSR